MSGTCRLMADRCMAPVCASMNASPAHSILWFSETPTRRHATGLWNDGPLSGRCANDRSWPDSVSSRRWLCLPFAEDLGFPTAAIGDYGEPRLSANSCHSGSPRKFPMAHVPPSLAATRQPCPVITGKRDGVSILGRTGIVNDQAVPGPSPAGQMAPKSLSRNSANQHQGDFQRQWPGGSPLALRGVPHKADNLWSAWPPANYCRPNALPITNHYDASKLRYRFHVAFVWNFGNLHRSPIPEQAWYARLSGSITEDCARPRSERYATRPHRSRPAWRNNCVTGSTRYCSGVRVSPLIYTSAGMPASSLMSSARASEAGSASTIAT